MSSPARNNNAWCKMVGRRGAVPYKEPRFIILSPLRFAFSSHLWLFEKVWVTKQIAISEWEMSHSLRFDIAKRGIAHSNSSGKSVLPVMPLSGASLNLERTIEY